MSILDLAKAAADLTPEDISANILIYGPSGNGKTHTAAQGGKPLILLTERNGYSTIIRANPDAKVIFVEESTFTDADGNEKTVEALNVVREVIGSVKSGAVKAAGYDRLVIDSVTEIQRLFKDEILVNAGKPVEDFSLKDWGILTEKMRRFFRTLRSLSIPVVAIALVDELINDAGNVTRIRPGFEGKKTAGEVAQFFSAVGFQAKRRIPGGDNTDEHTQYRVMFDGPERYMLKSCHPVEGVLEPDVPGWIHDISTSPFNEPEADDAAA